MLPPLKPLQLTNLGDFGVVPELKLRGQVFLECAINLEVGKHWGPHGGFGVRHIWAEHRLDMEKAGFAHESDVSAYVASIIGSGTRLFYEGASWRSTRLMAIRSTKGTVVLEYRDRRTGPIWSVVTAFPGTKTHGALVGTVR